MNGTTGVWAGAAVTLLGALLPQFGVHLTNPQLTSLVVVLAGVVGMLFGHHVDVRRAAWDALAQFGDADKACPRAPRQPAPSAETRTITLTGGGGGGGNAAGFARLPLLVVLVTAGLLALGGCSTMPAPSFMTSADSWNPTNYQGCTMVEASVYTPASKTPTALNWKDCKNKNTVVAMFDIPKGTLTYKATGVNGSQAAAIEGQVQQVFAKMGAQVTPAVAAAVTNLAITGFTGGASGLLQIPGAAATSAVPPPAASAAAAAAPASAASGSSSVTPAVP